MRQLVIGSYVKSLEYSHSKSLAQAEEETDIRCSGITGMFTGCSVDRIYDPGACIELDY